MTPSAWSIEMTAGVVTAKLTRRNEVWARTDHRHAQGFCRKDRGYRVTAEYFSNDFVIGNFIEKAGYRVVLSRHIIDHVVPPMTFRECGPASSLG